MSETPEVKPEVEVKEPKAPGVGVSKPMKILIGTPVFERMEPGYVGSLIKAFSTMIRNKVEFDIHFETRNFICQSRNRMAEEALRLKCDKLMFIDADIVFNPADLMKILISEKKIVGGVYPFKAFPIKLNFQPRQDVGLEGTFDPQKYVEDYAEKDTGEVEVHRLPTGFMCVDVSVFRDLEPHAQVYETRDPISGDLCKEHNYFPFEIEDGVMNTEDWGFCNLAQKHGFKAYWSSSVVVDHIGRHVYSAWAQRDEKTTQTKIGSAQLFSSKMDRTNPFIKWPNKYPCWCGSGLMFKRCHQTKMLAKCTEEQEKILIPNFKAQYDMVRERLSNGLWYKLTKPMPLDGINPNEELNKAIEKGEVVPQKHAPGGLE